MKRLLIAFLIGLYISMCMFACAPMMPKEGQQLPEGYDKANVDPVDPDNPPPAKPVEKPAADEGTE